MPSHIIPTRAPFLLPQSLADAWPSYCERKNPFTIWGRWCLEADPLWYEQRSYLHCLLAYYETGEQKYLDLALEDRQMMPLVSATQGVPHLSEIGYVVQFLLLEPYLTKELNAEWQRRLITLGESMFAYRIGDFDQCLTYLDYFKLCDKYIGTDFSTRDPALATWLDDTYMDRRDFQGGARDPSAGYETGTFELHSLAAAAYGKDISPWFDDWANEYAEFLTYSVSHDKRNAVCWGDQSAGDIGRVNEWHRAPLCFYLAGLGYRSEELASLGHSILTYRPAYGAPGTGHTGSGGLAQLVCDPGLIMDGPEVAPPSGTHLCTGIGTAIHSTQRDYAYVNMRRTRREDGSAVEGEDHLARGAAANFSWIHDGKVIAPQPGGYGIEGNEYPAYNAWCLKNQSWFDKQRVPRIEATPRGWIVEGISTGPVPTNWHSYGPTWMWQGEENLAGCEVKSRIEFDSAVGLTIEEEWTSPGNTFAEWTTDYPVFHRCQYALGPITASGSTLFWTVDGLPVSMECTMTDSAGKPVPVVFEIEPAPQSINSISFYRTFIKSPPDLLSGKLKAAMTLGNPAKPVNALMIDDPVLQPERAWTLWSAGHDGDLYYAPSGPNTATWTFGTEPGRYKVFATWLPHPNRATNALYRIEGQEFRVNQELDPGEWMAIGEATAGETLTVVLDAADADEYVIADAVRIERIGELPSTDVPVKGVIRGRQLIIELP